ncbi:hypothetical protein Q8F55_006897 [Vanrija albida]|uniref:THIF-type NAD/FAD binding fold domain-containing protein n=1 Tax=Vanrija albida TaxID=181172 RepID=A0ABR3PYD7_9TREE
MSGQSSLSSLSFKQSLAITAVIASLATTSVILTYQTLRREARTEQLKRSVGEDVEAWERRQGKSGTATPMTPEERVELFNQANDTGKKPREWRKGEFDESLVREQLTRNYSFLGDEAMTKIRNSYVVIVGCGGVGSWAATMLLRSGVGRLLLIDFDLVTLSSLNRHACATLEDVGTPKAVAMQKYFKKIAPWAQVDVQVALWKKDEGEAWLEGADYVLDAIDNIDTKIDLLTHCAKNDIKIFASMGAGAKRDPTRVQIADISNTYEDPLARSVRRRLRINGIPSGIPVVYSTEVPSDVKLLPLPEDEFKKGSVKELGAFDDFRVRILPVLGPLPAIFGLEAATYMTLELGGKPLTDCCEIKNRKKLYQNLERSLSEREARVAKSDMQKGIDVNMDDLALIFEDVNNGRTTIPEPVVTKQPNASRWDRDQPLTIDNIVILTPGDAKRHEKEHLVEGKSLKEVWGEENVLKARRRLDEARRCAIYRRA